MDDLAKKLTQLIESPEGMDMLKDMAGSLLNSNESANSPQEPKHSTLPDLSALSDLPISPSDMMKLLSVASQLKNSAAHDSRTDLLLALKPHLSETRRERVDGAVKLLKFSRLLPLLREEGLF